jgi:hypothetical protein
MKIIEKEFNAITGQETITERAATKQEIEFFAENKAKIEADKAEAKTKEIARAAILERLGLTAEEAALILG